MSIFNDQRRYGTEEEREQWEQEVKWEFRQEQYEQDHPYEREEEE